MKMSNLARMGLTMVILLAALAACVYTPPAAAPAGQMGVQGITGDLSGSIRIQDDLTVGGTAYFNGPLVAEGATNDAYETTIVVTDPTADRTITIGDDTGSVMLTSTPGVFVFGVNTVTGTYTITHGLTTPQTAFCTLGANSAAASNVCTVSISGANAVLKVWKNDGTTAGDAGVAVNWLIAGQQ